MLNIYRYTATGVFGYVGYDGEREICTASSLVYPNAPVYITGKNFEFVSNFDMDTTLVPGFTTRLICDKTSGNVIAKLRWEGQNSYMIMFASTQYRVCHTDKHYIFATEDTVPALVLNKVLKSNNVPEHILSKYNWCEVQLRFELNAHIDIATEEIAICAAIPMLEFGL